MDNSRINDYVRQLWNANSAEHIRTILNEYHEEFSKLHQPTVSGAVCAHTRTKLKGSRHSVIRICVDCGKFLVAK